MLLNKNFIWSFIVHIIIFSVVSLLFIPPKVSQRKKKPRYIYKLHQHVPRTTYISKKVILPPKNRPFVVKDPQTPNLDFSQQKDDFLEPLREEQQSLKFYSSRMGTERLTPPTQKNVTAKVSQGTSKTKTNTKAKSTQNKSLVSKNSLQNKEVSQNNDSKQDESQSKKTSSESNEKSLSQKKFSQPDTQAQILRPRLRKKFPIDYPRIAKRLRLSGKIMLRIRILKNGSVGEVEVVKGSGYRMLDSAAVKSVKKWLFFPAQKNGSPVNAKINVPISFRL